ncbi:hypothetical protein D9Q98_000319 [Chlorella vulgaris]|uniref:Uncharacterized protein n=1 Tax=Chlorella vulgaris TaxID=3077 RepID=A0A9D4Z118_CHLVU|nr:hypothetical protein D9Q98_000319 [Chlorella vulgaris]
MAADTVFGKLVIVGKDGFQDLEFPIDKKSILIGRDHSCDIRIVNKEISRKHAEVYVEDNGAVFISSMGREPVSVNGAPVTSPLELATGDKIEVLLENRTRVFYFQGDDETVQIRPPPPPTRKALADLNQGQGLQCAGAAKPAPAPAPPPPPPFGAMRGADKPAAVAPAPAPPSLPSKAAGAALASGAAGLAAALQDAIKAGVQLKKVQPAADKPAAYKPAGGGAFVPDLAELLKLRAGLRKTAPADPAPIGAQSAPEAPAAAAVAAPAEQAYAQPEQASVAEQAAPPASAPDVQQAGSGEAALEQPAGLVSDTAAPETAAADDSMADATAVEHATDGCEQAAGDPAGAAQPASEAALGEAAEERSGVPGSAVRKRKSVRFHVEEQAGPERVTGTPEGCARDATITIRLRRGDVEQIINVDDNTVALSLWGLGTMGEPLDDLPDTVVSKRSRHSTAAPSSAGKTPIRSALRELLAAASPAVSGCPQGTPGAMGPAAPASTPATGAAPAADRADGLLSGLVVDPATLAAKLTEMAEQHDVTLEVPLDFFSPAAAAGAESLRVVLTPKSQGRTPTASAAGPASDSLPQSAAKSAGVAAALHNSDAGCSEADGGLEPTRVVVLASEVLAAAAAQVSAIKRPQSASRRRSLSRTPGTKIVIIEQATQTTPASVQAASSARLASVGQANGHTSPRLQSTMAVRTEGVDDGEDVEQAAAQEQCDEGGGADGSLELEGVSETVPLKQYQKAVLRAKAHHAEARQLAAQLRRMASKAEKLKKAASALSGALDGERAKRQELQEAMQQVVLNRAAAELEDQLAVAAAEAGEEDQEQEEEQGAAAGVQMDAQSKYMVEGEEAPRAPRVVVLGKLTPAVSTAERAGEVVVVRPSHMQATAAGASIFQPQVVLLPASARKTPAPSAAKRASTPARGCTPATAGRGAATPGAALAAAGKTPASAVRTAGIPVLPKSMLKECPGTDGASRVVLESVTLPDWLFDGEQQAPEVAEAAAVASAEEMEVPAAAPEAAAEEQEHEEEEERRQVQAEAAGSEMHIDADAPALVQPGGEEIGAEQSAAKKKVGDQRAIARDPASDMEEAANEEGEEDEDFCHLCGQSDEGDILLLCDSCDNACHLSCCNPPLKRVPKGDWFCIDCAAKQAAEAAAAAAAAASMPAAKRGTKRQAGNADEASAAKPASRGRRAAVSALAPAVAAKPAEEQAPSKSARGRGSKRAAEQEPSAAAESEQPSVARGGKRVRPAAAPKALEEPAPSGRSLRGRAAASAAAGEEVSTRRGRGAAAASKPEAAPTRGTRSRR